MNLFGLEIKSRGHPKETRNNNGSLAFVVDPVAWESLECSGYTSLSHNPEIMTAVDTIARLVGSMTIHLMQNTENGDIRIRNGLSRLVDHTPNPVMTRSNFIRWIIKTMMLDGDGNAIVLPISRNGYIEELRPIPSSLAVLTPRGFFDYRVLIEGREYAPEDVLHFAANPSNTFPWKGQGYQIALKDVADNLKQATATEKGFMSSKWKPSLIVKVDALTEEFASPDGRRKLLEDYAKNSTAGEPWLIPAEQFSVEQVKPLTLSDLALSDFVKIDKETVASVLGIPPFVLGIGEFKADAWNSFIQTTIMPIAQNIQQELTRKLLISPDLYFRFNPRSLMSYDLSQLVNAGKEMVDHAAMRRNEWRDWLGLPPDPDMNDIIVLENYLPIDRLGDQKKLNQGSDGGDE